MKNRILSGMRPTGKLHLGHLSGALRNWVKFQEKYECFYMVADWHALMSEYEDTSAFREDIRDMVADWIACGIDPSRSTVFLQSSIKEHAEMHLLLSMVTPLGWLERCPTYKEQLQEIKNKDISSYAFLGYPVLQTADITLYRAGVVPVGNDQLPHLELAREIVRRFNRIFKTEALVEPEPALTESARLLGLDNRKMSKSYGNCIALSDEPAAVKKKVMSMITDPQRIRKTDKGRPEVCNVHSYYRAFAPEKADEAAGWCRSAAKGCTECKGALADILTGILAPIREKRAAVLSNAGVIDDILRDGNKRAREVASATMHEAKSAAGL